VALAAATLPEVAADAVGNGGRKHASEEGGSTNIREAVTGVDDDDTALFVTAIRHASGKRPQNSRGQ
jgi:hypothetical protein